ncbi:MAG: flagellar export protein FliJ [Herminiimonas sp.]|nr:flagellar export protein FliJ [Herminiimonas sp.]
MANRSALETLIELATTETEDAAKRLGMAVKATRETEKKLTLLQDYRAEYAARFQASLAAGLSAMGYRNFQLFMDKLDTAITSQQNVVTQANLRVEERRREWQAGERKRMSYGTLANRALQEELKLENKRDQKAMDEHAARQHLYKK